jgi:hypothetical protein
LASWVYGPRGTGSKQYFSTTEQTTMITELILYNDSFNFNGKTTIKELEARIESLAIDVEAFRRCGDEICKTDDLHYCNFLDGIPLCEVMYSDLTSRDTRRYLQILVERARAINESDTQIIESLDNHSKDQIRGLILFNSLPELQLSNQYKISTSQEWIQFHRYFLAIYPFNEEYFFNRAIKIFPKIYLHPRVIQALSTLEGGINIFSQTIVNALEWLNDHFVTYYNSRDRVNSLKSFSAASGFETTPEGCAGRKKSFTFDFPTNHKPPKFEPVCCEPHMKLSSSDAPGDSHHYSNRIYFHEGKPHLADGRILIGHIGGHL